MGRTRAAVAEVAAAAARSSSSGCRERSGTKKTHLFLEGRGGGAVRGGVWWGGSGSLAALGAGTGRIRARESGLLSFHLFSFFEDDGFATAFAGSGGGGDNSGGGWCGRGGGLAAPAARSGRSRRR